MSAGTENGGEKGVSVLDGVERKRRLRGPETEGSVD